MEKTYNEKLQVHLENYVDFTLLNRRKQSSDSDYKSNGVDPAFGNEEFINVSKTFGKKPFSGLPYMHTVTRLVE